MAVDFLEDAALKERAKDPHEGEVQNFRDFFGAPGSDWLKSGSRLARGGPWSSQGFDRRSPSYLRGPAEVERVFSQCWLELLPKATLSSVSLETALEPAYQRMLGLGLEAVPVLLAHLHELPSVGFLALNAIVGQDIAAGASDVVGAIDLWRDWGTQLGYLA